MGGSPHMAPCGHESKTRSVCQRLMSLWFSDARMAKKKKNHYSEPNSLFKPFFCLFKYHLPFAALES